MVTAKKDRLNSYSDKDMENIMSSHFETLRKFAGDVWSMNSHAARVTLWARWSSWNSIALYKIGLKRPPEEVREAFANAAREVVTFFDLCWKRREEVARESRPKVEDARSLKDGTLAVTHSIPFSQANVGDYMGGLQFALLGGVWKYRHALASMEQNTYHCAEGEDNSRELLLRGEIIRLLVRGEDNKARELMGPLEKAVCIEGCKYGPGAIRLEEIRCLIERNKSILTFLMHAHLEYHKKLAKRGCWRVDPHGLASFGGLAIARLALERGMDLDIQNPYLPLEIIRYPLQS